jgi:signal transduction histidine kinase
VLNLLNNARDAVEEQLERGSETDAALVSIRTAKSGGPAFQQVNIEVADTGTGIPHEIIDKVFDPFFTTKDPDQGTGLGLAISRSIIEECGGSLHIRSAEGNGTTVLISLPAAVDGVSKGSEDATY